MRNVWWFEMDGLSLSRELLITEAMRKSITEVALEKYPPKGMQDPQDWAHDENAELRKAFIRGYEYAYVEVMSLVDPGFDNKLNDLAKSVSQAVTQVAEGIMAAASEGEVDKN